MAYDDAALGEAERRHARWNLVNGPRRDTPTDRMRRCLEDQVLWDAYLDSLAERPDLSPRNLASMAVRRVEQGYESCADIRTLDQWEAAGASLRRGVDPKGAIMITVPRPGESSRKEFEERAYWPRCCVVGAPATPMHAPSVRYDVRRPRTIERLGRAMAEVELDTMAELAVWAVMTHFGLPMVERPQPPATSDLNGAIRLLKRVAEDADLAISEVERSLADDDAERVEREREARERSRQSPTYGKGDRSEGEQAQASPDYSALMARLAQSRRDEGLARRKAEDAKKVDAVPKGAEGQGDAQDGQALNLMEEEPLCPSGPPPVLPLDQAAAQVRVALAKEQKQSKKRSFPF